MAKVLKVFTQKLEGNPFTFDRRNQELYNQYESDAKPGCYQVTYKKAVKPKSHNQVKTIFGLMIESTIAQANDQGIDVSYFLKYLMSEYEPKGQGLTVGFLHELMYVICPTVDDEGLRVTLSKMGTVQAANLFESFRNIVSPLGIVIPDPNPYYKKECKAGMDALKEKE